MARTCGVPEWEPHTATVQAGVFASRFPGRAGTVWTIVNRNEYVVAGEQLIVPHQAVVCTTTTCGMARS